MVYFVFLRVLSSEKKRKRKNVDEDEVDYEKRLRIVLDQDYNERIFLFIKSKDSIIYRREKLLLIGVCI